MQTCAYRITSYNVCYTKLLRVIQPNDTFFGLTGPGVVKSVLGEDITPEELGGPKVHGASGVV